MTERGRDETTPKGRWEFDAEVAAVFDDMLARSIPQYQDMRDLVTSVAARFVRPATSVVDLGCSRGEALEPLVRRFGACNRFVGIDVSEPMLELARERFAGYIKTGVVDIRRADLRTEYPQDMASATLAVLTVQFVPIEYRMQIFRNVFQHTVHGGAALIVEKVLGATPAVDDCICAEYFAMKGRNGYTGEQIARKRASLEGVLVPITAAWNCDMLRCAGFSDVDCIWRWCNFAAFLAVRA